MDVEVVNTDAVTEAPTPTTKITKLECRYSKHQVLEQILTTYFEDLLVTINLA